MAAKPQNAFDPDSPKVWTIPAGVSFLRRLAEHMVAGLGACDNPEALADVIVYVPNQRSAKTLARELYAAIGKPFLPPDIRKLGDLEHETPPSVESALAHLSPPLPAARRTGALAALVTAFYKSFKGQDIPPSGAIAAATELGRLLDQAALSEDVNWSRLPELLDESDLAHHWQDTVEFLKIVTEHWPQWLSDNKAEDPLVRRLKAAEAMRVDWIRNPPSAPVIIAGSTGATPASRVLMDAIQLMPLGVVVLSSVDRNMDAMTTEEVRQTVGHPQNALVATLDFLGLAPSLVPVWPGALDADTDESRARRRLIHESLAPADATADWREKLKLLAKDSGSSVKDFTYEALRGLKVMAAADEGEEAMMAALLLRETLETPEATAALITPDAGLMRRVTALLKRWNVQVPPSGGIPLSRTEPGSLLGLCARFALDPGAPIPMMSVLKHPLVNVPDGLTPLDKIFLRGARRWRALSDLPDAIRTLKDVSPYASFTDEERDSAIACADWLSGHVLQTGVDFTESDQVDAVEAINRLSEFVNGISVSGSMWTGEAGIAVSRCIESLRELASQLGPLSPEALIDLVESQLANQMVQQGGPEHPRLSIWGPLEARLQTADRLILAGLNEDVWPQRPPVDSFLPRRFREDLGLNDQEERMGLAAHDFAQLASAPDVTLLYSARRDDVPAVMSRWVWRLKTLIRGAFGEESQDAILSPNSDRNALQWARGLAKLGENTLASDFSAEPRPSRVPEGWPEKLSVTRVEMLQRDPYAIWAQNVLKLDSLDPFSAPLGPAPRGTAIHKAIERFEIETGPRSADRLLSLLEHELLAVGETVDDWTARRAVFADTCEWFVGWLTERTLAGEPWHERRGQLSFEIAGQPFILSAVADRIERLPDGQIGIVDYKSGTFPSDKQIATQSLGQQMPLQALIAEKGGFESVSGATVAFLEYVAFKAKPAAHRICSGAKPVPPTALAERAEAGLLKLISEYRHPGAKFLSAPRVQFISHSYGYDRLARRAEWATDIREAGDA